ncbi:MAG TPA: diacylglycerol kinase family protein [Gemmatimonadaceae bacterium]|nr:diacylglycerol kinase family protein [Gemmatimonadaceae bacterium]
MANQLIVLINAGAGSDDKEQQTHQLEEIFRSRGVEARIAVARTGDALREMARDAVRERPAVIVAGGGDGTIGAVASALVGTDIALGVLPLGTLNHFAKDLHIPQGLEEAVTNIVGGRIIQVDVGEVNGRIFLNNSSLGLYPRVVRIRKRQQERLGRGKWPAFVWAAFTVLRRHAFLPVRLAVNAQEVVRRTSFVFVGNNEYEMAGIKIGRRKRLDGGQLSLYLPRRSGRLAMLVLAIRGLLGLLRKSRDLDALLAESIVVEPRQRHLHVANDGEVLLMETPLSYRSRPAALRVIVPHSL